MEPKYGREKEGGNLFQRMEGKRGVSFARCRLPTEPWDGV